MRTLIRLSATALLTLSITTAPIAAAQPPAQGRGQAPAAPAPPLPTPGPTMAEALKALEAARAAAVKLGVNLSCAVVDSRGDLVALTRMDGARFFTTDTAIGKAMMSAMFGQPSAAFVGRGNTPLMQGLNESSGGRLRFFQGALPIVRGGFTVGAFAASGASAQQDEDAVRAALSTFR